MIIIQLDQHSIQKHIDKQQQQNEPNRINTDIGYSKFLARYTNHSKDDKRAKG